jgi:6-phosphogluconolactonase
MESLQILSTPPSTFPGDSRSAEIAIDCEGRTLYASNRGHDSIASFRIDAETETGMLQFVGTDPPLGRTPRFFSLSPTGKHLFALNEESDSINTLVVDPSTGRLLNPSLSIKSGSPVCMHFAV